MTGSMNIQHRRPDFFWLIVKKGAGHEDALTLDLDGEEKWGKTLPVFYFEEEARMFLSLGDGWQVKETATGELISMFLGPCAGIEFVSLDPLPELIHRRMLGLVSLRRKQFVEGLTGGANPREGTLVKENSALLN